MAISAMNPTTLAEKLFACLLINEKMHGDFHISKKEFYGNAIVEVLFKLRGKRTEEHIMRFGFL